MLKWGASSSGYIEDLAVFIRDGLVQNWDPAAPPGSEQEKAVQ